MWEIPRAIGILIWMHHGDLVAWEMDSLVTRLGRAQPCMAAKDFIFCLVGGGVTEEV